MNHEKCGGYKFDTTTERFISDPACTSDEVLLLQARGLEFDFTNHTALVIISGFWYNQTKTAPKHIHYDRHHMIVV